jgi:hypothetical protein
MDPGRKRIRSRGEAQFVHLVHGDSAANTLCQAGRPFEGRLVLRDVLSTGPCHADPAVHPVLRRMHWSRLAWLHWYILKSVLSRSQLIARGLETAMGR